MERACFPADRTDSVVSVAEDEKAFVVETGLDGRVPHQVIRQRLQTTSAHRQAHCGSPFASLITRTFVNLKSVDLGFSPEHVLSVETRWPLGATSMVIAPGHRRLLCLPRSGKTAGAYRDVRTTPGPA